MRMATIIVIFAIVMMASFVSAKNDKYFINSPYMAFKYHIKENNQIVYVPYLPPKRATLLLYDDFNGTSLNTSNWFVMYQKEGRYGVKPENYTIEVGDSKLILAVIDHTAGDGGDSVSLFSSKYAKDNMTLIVRFSAPDWGGLGRAGYYREVKVGFYVKFVNTYPSKNNEFIGISFSESDRGVLIRYGNVKKRFNFNVNPEVMNTYKLVLLGSRLLVYLNGKLVVNTTVIKPATAETVVYFNVGSWAYVKPGKLIIDYVKFYQGAVLGTSSSTTLSKPTVKIVKMM